MGIEGFFKTIQKKKNTGIISNYKIKINDQKTNCVCVDFNSILYQISAQVEEELGLLLCNIIYNNDFKNDHFCQTIAQKYNYNLITGTVETFAKQFRKQNSSNGNDIDEKIISMVGEYIENMLMVYGDEKHLKKMFIAMDGIPIMAKIIEQKHRRYMGYVSAEMGRNIYLKYENSISQNRKIYEENKYRFDRNNIVTWADFMVRMENKLISAEFTIKLKDLYPLMEQIIVSGPKYPGEGEKKIMEFIMAEIKQDINSNYLLTSPDADMILLAIILTNIAYINKSKSLIDVLHYSPDKKTYEYVNIDKFVRYITNYVINNFKKEVGIISSDELRFKIANDFVLLATVFGNDFLPKIQSINVKTDFELLLDLYRYQFNGKILNELISIDTSIVDSLFKINTTNLINYFNNLEIYEPYLLRHKYLSQNYDMFTIRSVYDFRGNSIELVNNIYEYISKYGALLQKIYMFQGEIPNRKDISQIKRQKNDAIYGYIRQIVYQQNRKDREFMKQFNTFELGPLRAQFPDEKNFVLGTRFLYRTFILHRTSNTIVLPLSGILKTDKLEEHQINTYKSNKVIDFFINKEGLTEYDENMIKFEWKMGEYKDMLNAGVYGTDSTLGIVTIDFSDLQKPYMPDIDYNEYNINYMKINTYKDNDYLNKMNNYIFGIYWLIDQYFNKNDMKFNLDNVTTWFYPGERAPLIGDISNVLRHNEMYKLNQYTEKDIDEFNIKRSDFVNSIEQLLYISPSNKLLKDAVVGSLPEQYRELIAKNKTMFPDINDQIKKIWEGKNPKEYIDCRRITFITKCILEKVKNLSWNEYKKYVVPLRETITDPKQKQLIETQTEHKTIELDTQMNNLFERLDIGKEMEQGEEQEQSTGEQGNGIQEGGHYEINEMKKSLISYMKQYKKQYIVTKNINYKKSYKEIKHMISSI
ncbi:MAG: XRN 5'-3' exonuclease [Terrestrivirus sp.]|uniref:XRN 5'-3' exonuclease n=1 Tax=Terrestrivirus sp. TaxID=2487775 RepID=A0A3G4ZPE3_9VIRU|nr:MAG: XRN 5'-3' exonuclease [Terrestrivirus sp.]